MKRTIPISLSIILLALSGFALSEVSAGQSNDCMYFAHLEATFCDLQRSAPKRERGELRLGDNERQTHGKTKKSPKGAFYKELVEYNLDKNTIYVYELGSYDFKPTIHVGARTPDDTGLKLLAKSELIEETDEDGHPVYWGILEFKPQFNGLHILRFGSYEQGHYTLTTQTWKIKTASPGGGALCDWDWNMIAQDWECTCGPTKAADSKCGPKPKN